MTRSKWLTHLNDGKTLTDQDCYPHEAPQDKITSVERVVECPDGHVVVASVLKSDVLTNFFVKTTASKAMVAAGGGSPSPEEVEERIVGAFITPQDSPVRLELFIEPRTGNVKLRVVKVSTMRKDGL